jgi:hypothetical protein
MIKKLKKLFSCWGRNDNKVAPCDKDASWSVKGGKRDVKPFKESFDKFARHNYEKNIDEICSDLIRSINSAYGF